MNKLMIIISISLISCYTNAQLLPSSHRNDIKNRNFELPKELKIEKADENPDKITFNVDRPKKPIIVPPETINIYNPYSEEIKITIVYPDATKELITVKPQSYSPIKRNTDCKSIIVYGNKVNYCTTNLIKNNNYDFTWNPSLNCFCLINSVKLKTQKN